MVSYLINLEAIAAAGPWLNPTLLAIYVLGHIARLHELRCVPQRYGAESA